MEEVASLPDKVQITLTVMDRQGDLMAHPKARAETTERVEMAGAVMVIAAAAPAPVPVRAIRTRTKKRNYSVPFGGVVETRAENITRRKN